MRVLGVDQSYSGFGYSIDGEAKKKAFPISKFPGEIERLDVILVAIVHSLRQRPAFLVAQPQEALRQLRGRRQKGRIECARPPLIGGRLGKPVFLREFLSDEHVVIGNESTARHHMQRELHRGLRRFT